MKILKLLALGARLAYARWAMSEINPLHRDVPTLALELHGLEERWNKEFKA